MIITTKLLIMLLGSILCGVASIYGVKVREHPVGFILVFLGGYIMGSVRW